MLQVLTRGYRNLQWVRRVMGGHKGLQEVPGGYRKLQGVTGG